MHAGLPNPVDDAPADALTIDDYLIEHPSQTVLVRVKGDSMSRRRDLSTAIWSSSKSAAAARRGDIVIAIVDNQFTLKRLDLERGRFILRPENKAYPIIRPEGALEIFGVMVGLSANMRNAQDVAAQEPPSAIRLASASPIELG